MIATGHSDALPDGWFRWIGTPLRIPLNPAPRIDPDTPPTWRRIIIVPFKPDDAAGAAFAAGLSALCGFDAEPDEILQAADHGLELLGGPNNADGLPGGIGEYQPDNGRAFADAIIRMDRALLNNGAVGHDVFLSSCGETPTIAGDAAPVITGTAPATEAAQ